MGQRGFPPGFAVRPPPASGVLPHRFAMGEMTVTSASLSSPCLRHGEVAAKPTEGPRGRAEDAAEALADVGEAS
jgi:hypothetical protein